MALFVKCVEFTGVSHAIFWSIKSGRRHLKWHSHHLAILLIIKQFQIFRTDLLSVGCSWWNLSPKSEIRKYFSHQDREFSRFSEYSVRRSARTVHGDSHFAAIGPVHDARRMKFLWQDAWKPSAVSESMSIGEEQRRTRRRIHDSWQLRTDQSASSISCRCARLSFKVHCGPW